MNLGFHKEDDSGPQVLRHRIIFRHPCGKPEKNDKDQQLEDFFRAAGARDVILAASGAMTK